MIYSFLYQFFDFNDIISAENFHCDFMEVFLDELENKL